MQNPSGTFIVLEGADGSGKGTQFKLLKARLEAIGHEVEVFDFPRYDHESSHFVREYLNGGYGKASSVNPYTASIFFALDRYEAAAEIKKAIAAGKVVMSNRYVGSNMAHQGSKFTNAAEQRGFFVWEDNLEYELLGIPRPTLNIFLKVPADIAYELIAKKAARSYTTKKRDEHEADIEHLRSSVATYELLCQLFPNDFKLIDCVHDGQLMSIPDINNLIWQSVLPLLPAKPAGKAKPMTVRLGNTSEQAKSTAGNADTHAITLKINVPQACLLDALLGGLKISSINDDWAKNNYAYYTPESLPKKLLAKYLDDIGQMTELHKAMVPKLKKARASQSTLHPATPLAAMVQLSVSSTPHELQNSLETLDKSPSPSAHLLARELRRAAHQQLNPKAKAGKNYAAQTQPEPINKIIARLSAEQLPQSLGAQPEPIELLESYPRNEFKALADILYIHSKLSRPELEAQLDGWNYQQKADALATAINSGDPQILDKFRYQLDITCERSLIHEVIKSGIGTDIKVQPATPRFGYDVPHIVDEALITDDFLTCFDKSLELYSSLQAGDHDNLAPYATLLGHKSRFEATISLAAIRAAKPGSEQFNHLLTLIKQKVAERHPIVGENLNGSGAGEPKVQTPSSKPRRRHRSRKPKKS